MILISYDFLTLQRGEHDIENQMIFEGNPGFVFHDSRGFEAGGDRELKIVQRFIQQRSKARNVNKQLHVIWCVGTSIYRTNKFLTREKLLCVGTASQQLMTDQSLQQRGSFSMTVGQDWVGFMLSICCYNNDCLKYQ